MRHIIIFSLLFLLISNAEAQRVYAPDITGKSDVHYSNESLVFILKPEKIQSMQTTESQVHIQLTDSAREYFYTLTMLNIGKKLVIKSAGGETIQSGTIRKAIDSGIIISKAIKGRNNIIKFAHRVKLGKQPFIIKNNASEIDLAAAEKRKLIAQLRKKQQQEIEELKKELLAQE